MFCIHSIVIAFIVKCSRPFSRWYYRKLCCNCNSNCICEVRCFDRALHSVVKEYDMSEADRKQLSEFLRHDGDGSSYGTVIRGMIAVMAVGGALILIGLVIGLVACLIGRRSATVC